MPSAKRVRLMRKAPADLAQRAAAVGEGVEEETVGGSPRVYLVTISLVLSRCWK